jgi:3-phenylpropionate/trans-cinnamate dioxygenase ferredoxin reductase subunit
MNATDSNRHIVIVGAGHAGGCAAQTLRSSGHSGLITMLGDEVHPPYERPPLSKDLLSGAIEVHQTYLRPHAWYQDANVLLRMNNPVAEIDRVSQRIRLQDGDTVPYDSLLIATGARPRPLVIPGADGARVFYLRNIVDALALRKQLQPGIRIAIIGAGFHRSGDRRHRTQAGRGSDCAGTRIACADTRCRAGDWRLPCGTASRQWRRDRHRCCCHWH